MSLIERLRYMWQPIGKQAADEIERLTAELKHSVDKDQHNAIVRQKNERIAELEAFIEAPIQCHSCGSWGPFERPALQGATDDN